MTPRAVEEEETHGGLIFREKVRERERVVENYWACIQNTERSKSWKHPKAKKGKARGGGKSLGMLKINNVRQLFHCYSNLFKCYWRVFVPSRLLAAALMFEEAVPASAAVRPLPPPSNTHPFLSYTLSAKTLLETERERESSENMQDSRWEESVWVWEEVTLSTCVRRVTRGNFSRNELQEVGVKAAD